MTYVSGTIAGKEVVAAVCGIGKVFAAICAEAMILKYNVDCVINIGVGGTLCKELGVMDVAVADQVVQHDMNTSAWEIQSVCCPDWIRFFCRVMTR